jgi:hypothetical protein
LANNEHNFNEIGKYFHCFCAFCNIILFTFTGVQGNGWFSWMDEIKRAQISVEVILEVLADGRSVMRPGSTMCAAPPEPRGYSQCGLRARLKL